ncbi:MAG: tyrosine-type recombinase/integrase [Armatimonadota bacterium]
MRQSEHFARNPLAAVTTPKRPQHLSVYLSPQECQRPLDATDSNYYLLLAFQDIAVLGTLIYTGIRRNELLHLRLGDLDLAPGMLRVRSGKGQGAGDPAVR